MLPASTNGAPLAQIRHERSKERSSDYFATTHNLSTKDHGATVAVPEKVPSRAASGNKKVPVQSPAKFFTKIQTLVRAQNSSQKRPPSEEHKRTELSFNSLKGALMKTITLQTKTITREKTAEKAVHPGGTNTSSSIDSKQVSGCNSERKLIKSSGLMKRVNDARKHIAGTHHNNGTNKVAAGGAAASKDRLSPASRIRSRVNAKAATKSKDQSSVDSSCGLGAAGRTMMTETETSGTKLREPSPGNKNPEYFEINTKPVVAATITKAALQGGVSPGAAKDGKFAFNIKKILATTKGAQRASASNLKNAKKTTPVQAKGRPQAVAFSDGY